MLSTKELQLIMVLVDAGIKSAGIQIFQNEGGTILQSALAKFQEIADEAARLENAQKNVKE